MNALKVLREKAGKLQKEVALDLGIKLSTYCQYENSRRIPDPDTIMKIADYFQVSTDAIYGHRPIAKNKEKGVKVPVFGYVRAGIPIEAITDILDYEDISADMATHGEFFALKVRGDSMEPVLTEGDTVIIRQQPDVESGEIAVVMVNGDDAVIKRVQKLDSGINLISINPSYAPMYFSAKDIAEKPVTFLGKMVELRRKF